MAQKTPNEVKPAPKISAMQAKYIKLGKAGCWEELCLADGTLRLSYNEVPHEIAVAGDYEGLRAHFRQKGLASQISSSHAKQVLDFYQVGAETLWIGFLTR